ARKADQAERAHLAHAKAAELEPALPMLTIVVPPFADSPDLELRRDGEIVGRPEWGVAIPVDPGQHVIDAVAPGRKAWQGSVQITGAGAKQSIELPLLEPLPPPAAPDGVTPAPIASAPAAARPVAPATALRETSGGAHGQRAAAWVVGGIGVAGLAAGGALGIAAAFDHAKSSHNCIYVQRDLVCTGAGYSQGIDAEHLATASTIAIAGGGAFVVAAAVLFWTAPSRRDASWRLAPAVGAHSATINIGGRW
ncbi:MAG: hypothetical protein FWD17_10080, partial [Polyangiaceae bacterium]|nr:hypothetical protein [Polyangiaceae bacterium]